MLLSDMREIAFHPAILRDTKSKAALKRQTEIKVLKIRSSQDRLTFKLGKHLRADFSSFFDRLKDSIFFAVRKFEKKINIQTTWALNCRRDNQPIITSDKSGMATIFKKF